MRKLLLVVHTSLDGFVAGLNGELDGFEPGEDNLAFVCDLTETADAALFGRISYQLLESNWPTVKDIPGATLDQVRYSNWYNSAQKIIISKSISEKDLINSIVLREIQSDSIKSLKEQPGKDILIFGSPAVSQQLMSFDLIDEYWIFIHPAIFGKGIPLFSSLNNNIKLKLASAKQLSKGELALHYVRK